ncbi:hypothetical protein SRABI80_02940 [Peribacillus frigoritolerans]|nr:hypothetical protein SRABI80_02940 [Peribacillus frigoritolerans]
MATVVQYRRESEISNSFNTKSKGRVVAKANREVTFSEMSEFLYIKSSGNVSRVRIDEALADYKHLTNHCKQSQKKKILM